MPPPQLNTKSQIRERPTYEEIIFAQLQDTKTEVKDTRKELNARMDRLERRMDRIETRLDEQDKKIDRLADKIDALSNKIDTALNHGQIITVSAISIAVGVLYAVFFK